MLGSSPFVSFRERWLHALSGPDWGVPEWGWLRNGTAMQVCARSLTTPACMTWSRPPHSVSAVCPVQRSCSRAASLWSPPPCYCWWGCCSCWKWKPSLRCWSWAWWESFGARWQCPSSRPSCPARSGPASGPAAWQSLESCDGPGCDMPAVSGCGLRLPEAAPQGTDRAAPLACGRMGLSSCRGEGCRIHLREEREESVHCGYKV